MARESIYDRKVVEMIRASGKTGMTVGEVAERMHADIGKMSSGEWGMFCQQIIRCLSIRSKISPISRDVRGRPMVWGIFDPSRMSASQMIRSLSSGDCPACGGRKREKMSLCNGCYHKLDKDVQRRLYSRIGCGYEAAFREAIKALRPSD